MTTDSSPTYYEALSNIVMDENQNASLQVVLSSIVESVKTVMRIKGFLLSTIIRVWS